MNQGKLEVIKHEMARVNVVTCRVKSIWEDYQNNVIPKASDVGLIVQKELVLRERGQRLSQSMEMKQG